MSRKSTVQKRQATGFGGLGGMITAYPQRPVSRTTPARRRVTARRVAREEHWFSQPRTLIAVSSLTLAFVCCFLLAWQVQSQRSALSQAHLLQDGLNRSNRELGGQRDRLLATDNIVSRARALGLYPAGPDQVRKAGGTSAAG